MMGSPLTEVGRARNELQHKRRIQRTFALAAKPVTVEQFRKFNDSYKPLHSYNPLAEYTLVRSIGAGPEFTLDGARLGTPSYMAPDSPAAWNAFLADLQQRWDGLWANPGR